MDYYPQLSNKIKELLRVNPRGMTVTEVSNELKISRKVTINLLDAMHLSGFLEMKMFGTVRVYFLSQRIPLSTILDYISDKIIVLNNSLQILQVNKAFLDSWNYSIEKILGKPLHSLSIPYIKENQMMNVIETALNGKQNTVVVTYECEKCEERDIHCFSKIKLVPTLLEDNSPGVTMISEDITEIRTLEEQLQLERDILKKYLEYIDVMIVILDRKGEIILINQEGCNILGYQEEELIGKNWFETCIPSE
ncbi:MAG: PAS domain-containing protein, partial [Promethearchaeota archaeon]